MTHLLIFLRGFVCAIILVVLSTSWTVAEEMSGESPVRTKREFMEMVSKDIDGKQTAIRAEMEESKQKGNGAPLFVQIPTLIPFIDFDYWYIDRDLRWAPPGGSTLPSVKVPKGFVSDLASVPALFWMKYPPTGRYAYGAIVHDYLYWSRQTTKEVADEIFAIAMRDAGTDESTITTFKVVLGAAGWKAWSDNDKAKRSGEKRVLAVFPTDRLISWEVHKIKPGVFKD